MKNSTIYLICGGFFCSKICPAASECTEVLHQAELRATITMKVSLKIDFSVLWKEFFKSYCILQIYFSSQPLTDIQETVLHVTCNLQTSRSRSNPQDTTLCIAIKNTVLLVFIAKLAWQPSTCSQFK